jgi:glyoxylase I family protein
MLVDDLGAAERFYVDAIGCRITARIAHLGMTELTAGSFSIDIVDTSRPEGAWAQPGVRGGRNLDHFCLAIRGCTEAELRHHLSACNAVIESERRERNATGEELSLYVRDPSGNLVELLSRS